LLCIVIAEMGGDFWRVDEGVVVWWCWRRSGELGVAVLKA